MIEPEFYPALTTFEMDAADPRGQNAHTPHGGWFDSRAVRIWNRQMNLRTAFFRQQRSNKFKRKVEDDVPHEPPG